MAQQHAHVPLTTLLCAALVALTAAPALAAQSFDFDEHVEAELARPNVRMVAVVFSASWCGPCKAEQPEWHRIKATFGQRGVRLLVIRYKDADGRMKTYDWPDQEFWDDTGRIGDAFGVGDALPAAFLWTWQGRLVVKKGKVGDVARNIQTELARSPRVLVEAQKGAGGAPDDTLRALMENELTRLGKFDVLVTQDDRKHMAALRKASHGVQRSEHQRCKLGAAMSANSVVSATMLGDQLVLTLKDVEKACLTHSSTTRVNPANLASSVAEAVAALAQGMKAHKVELPAGTYVPEPEGPSPRARGLSAANAQGGGMRGPLIYGGAITFVLAWVGIIVGTVASDPWEGQTDASLVPVAGPFMVASINSDNDGENSNLPAYISGVFQIASVAAVIAGVLIDDGQTKTAGRDGSGWRRLSLMPQWGPASSGLSVGLGF